MAERSEADINGSNRTIDVGLNPTELFLCYYVLHYCRLFDLIKVQCRREVFRLLTLE